MRRVSIYSIVLKGKDDYTAPVGRYWEIRNTDANEPSRDREEADKIERMNSIYPLPHGRGSRVSFVFSILVKILIL